MCLCVKRPFLIRKVCWYPVVSIKLCKIVFITRPKYQEMSVDYKTIKNQFCQNLKKKNKTFYFAQNIWLRSSKCYLASRPFSSQFCFWTKKCEKRSTRNEQKKISESNCELWVLALRRLALFTWCVLRYDWKSRDKSCRGRNEMPMAGLLKNSFVFPVRMSQTFF